MSSAAKPLSQWAVGIESTLQKVKRKPLREFASTLCDLEFGVDVHSLWVFLRWSRGKTTWALRTCYDPQGALRLVESGQGREGERFFRIEGGLGDFRVELRSLAEEGPLFRYTTTLTPRADTLIEAMPRDLYLLGDGLDARRCRGKVLGKQKAHAAAFAFFTQDKPAGGAGLYFQQLTSLNDYFQTTQTDARELVAGDWPEIGLALPMAKKPLRKGVEVCISDAFLKGWGERPASETEASRWFLDGVAEIYPHLNRPKTSYFDWPEMSGRTLRSLAAKGCRQRIGGRTYFNSYVGSNRKPPESMVQFALLVPLLEFEAWRGRRHAMSRELLRSLPTFYDRDVGSVVRWLPGQTFDNAGHEPSEEEDVELIDSWYLYHVMLNLARLAQMGIAEAEKVFRDSLSYAVRVARHFEYCWPVFFKMKSLAVVKAETEPGTGGEQDVPGLYIKLMMMAHEILDEQQYLDEAIAAAKLLRGLGFELLYQTNNTMFSGDGLLRLWKATGDREYLDLSQACMANVVAKMWIWQCDYGHAKHYTSFMGVAPLQDAEYVAAYEEAESFATAMTYLQEAGEQLPDSIGLLLGEYMKYLLERGRYYYPANLPEDAVSTEPKEGHLERNLAIPLEDIRTGWQKAGQVGQEVYGAATAFVLAAHAYLRRKQVPFLIFSEYPVVFSDFRVDRRGSGTLHARLSGSPRLTCRLRLIPLREALPRIQLSVEGTDERPKPKSIRSNGSREYTVPGGAAIQVDWRPDVRKQIVDEKLR